MEIKSRQTSLSKAHEEILQKGTESIQQGLIDVQTLLDRSECNSYDEVITELLDQVDDSDYSMSDWLAALFAFDEWLRAKKVESRPLESMIGYIHCCTMTSAETLSPPELSRLVLESLNEWGFDAAQPVSGE